MADPLEDRIIDAIADPNQTVEADGDRVTRRSVKELAEALDIVRAHRSGKPRSYATLRSTRYDG